MNYRKYIKWGVILLVLLLIFLYKTYNPAGNIYFPKCPFFQITGFKCPGCGSQRAIHYLLNLDIKAAFVENSLLVVSIPYVLLGFIFDIRKLSEKGLKWRRILFGTTAIYIVLAVVIAFWILRNVF